MQDDGERYAPTAGVLGWFLLAGSAWLAGAMVSGLASSLGWTDFANDHRGEWAAMTLPLLATLSAAILAWALRRLRRAGIRRWLVAAIFVPLAAASATWITWQFAQRDTAGVLALVDGNA